MRKQRKHYTAEQKFAIVRRHGIDKPPVSELCEVHGLQPTVFYRWQKDLFANGAAALERRNGRREARTRDARARRIEALQEKLLTFHRRTRASS